MKKITLTLLILFITFSVIPSLAQENEIKKTNEVRQVELRINQIILDAGVFFKQGLISLKDNRRRQSRDFFNKSVETFLVSDINLTTLENTKLKDCYSQLVETIYRIEFPSDATLPQIRPLSATCGWNIDNQTADDIAKLVRQLIQVKLDAVDSNPPNKIIGFSDQKFEASPLDELSKLELTPEEINTPKTQYKRPPTPINIGVTTSNIRVVKAEFGDTITKLAQRHNANATEVAKFNGLLTTSPLGKGREIRIPSGGSSMPQKESQRPRSVKLSQLYKYPIYEKPSPVSDAKLLGVKPTQLANGKVSIVMNYFNEFFHDPYSMRFVRWSKVEKNYHLGILYWAVYVKYRAKNSFGAYVLSEMTFYIKNNKVVATKKLD